MHLINSLFRDRSLEKLLGWIIFKPHEYFGLHFPCKILLRPVQEYFVAVTEKQRVVFDTFD